MPGLTEPFQGWAWRTGIQAASLFEQSQKLGFTPHSQCVLQAQAAGATIFIRSV